MAGISAWMSLGEPSELIPQPTPSTMPTPKMLQAIAYTQPAGGSSPTGPLRTPFDGSDASPGISQRAGSGEKLPQAAPSRPVDAQPGQGELGAGQTGGGGGGEADDL